MWVDVDPPRELKPLWSRRAAEALGVLEACAGAPAEALGLIFPGVEELLRILRHTGHVRRCYLPGYEALWVPSSVPLPTVESYPCRLALGWAICRAVQAGLRVSRGHIRFSDGKVFRVVCYPGMAGSGNLLVVSTTGEQPRDLTGAWLFTTLAAVQARAFTEALAVNRAGAGSLQALL